MRGQKANLKPFRFIDSFPGFQKVDMERCKFIVRNNFPAEQDVESY